MKTDPFSRWYPVVTIFVFISIWYMASNSGLVNRTLFPPPEQVLMSSIGMMRSGELFLHMSSSLWRVLIGLSLGSLGGITIGLFTGKVEIIDKSLSPLLQILRCFPPVAIIPLVIVWLGIGETAKLFSISFAVFFPVWINTHVGVSNVPEHYSHVTSTLTSSILKKWLRVILPASLPFIFAGVRTAIGIAFIMVFVSELAGSSSGLGYLISVSHLAYRIDRMIVGLIALGISGAIADYIFVNLIRRRFPWIEKA